VSDGGKESRKWLERHSAVTSEVPQAWFVVLQDDASAGRVLAPLRPFLRFSRRIDRQLKRLEKQTFEAIPQLMLRQVARASREARLPQ